MPNEQKLTALLDKYARRSDTGQVSFALASPSRDWAFHYESEPEPKPYFAASVTKLYTVAIIMQLRQEGKLRLDDHIAKFLDAHVVRGLNVYKGTDHSEKITVKQLLAHTSGIAGYFDQKRDDDGGTLVADIVERDRAWTAEQAIEMAKTRMSAHFAPGTPGKAFYSDTNYHLLGLIVERITGKSWDHAVVARVIKRLHLESTWPFRTEDLPRYDEVAPILWGTEPVRIPLAITSVNAHGGLVSTAQDGIVFLQAFLGGRLFDAAYLDEMRAEWNRIFFPLRYGMGLMRYSMFAVGGGPKEYIGHSGSTGTVLFYAPDADLYISGSINQLKKRALVYQLMSRLGALAVGR